MAKVSDGMIENLGEDKAELIRIAASFADDVSKEAAPKGRAIWRFHFDEGAYKGQTVMEIRQDKLSPLAVLNMLKVLNSSKAVDHAQPVILEILRQHASQH